MKREGHLFTKITDIDNLRLAFWKARKSKDYRKEVIKFRLDLDYNLLTLKTELEDLSIKIGFYHYFNVYEPKERNICAASFMERVLHHAIMNICHSNFSKYQIKNSFASQKGKGTYAAIQQAKIYNKRYGWFLKLDVRKYFDKIDHSILKTLLNKRFKDVQLVKLFEMIIDSYSSEPNSNKGVPIGNLTSQYFANHYLGFADHFVERAFKNGKYIRYMDDMVFWSDDKKELLKFGYIFENFLKTELKLNLKPFCLNRTSFGLPFLGYTLFPNYVKLTNNSKKRFKLKLKKYLNFYKANIWSQATLQRHLLPLYAFVNFCDSKGLKNKLMKNLDDN